MEDFNGVLSDIIAGIFLLLEDHKSIVQSQQLRIKAEEREANGKPSSILQCLPNILQTEPIAGGQKPKKPKLSLKSFTEQNDGWTSIYFLNHYVKYAVASYTFPLLCSYHVKGSSVCRCCTRMFCFRCIP